MAAIPPAIAAAWPTMGRLAPPVNGWTEAEGEAAPAEPVAIG